MEDGAIDRLQNAALLVVPVSGVTSAPAPIVSAPTAATSAAANGGLLLFVRLGEQRYALPCDAVQRILPMAAPTLFPGAPAGVIGVLAFGGQLLPIIDPRPRLLLAAVTPNPHQHLIVLRATTTFLLWVDRADAVQFVPPAALIDVTTADSASLAPQLARLGGESIPVLAPQAFDPGPLLRRAAGGGA